MSADTHLRQAHRQLEETVTRADDSIRDDLRDIAADLASITAGDQPVDHAVVDGYLNELRQARRDADDAIAAEIDAAIESLSAYREDLDQA